MPCFPGEIRLKSRGTYVTDGFAEKRPVLIVWNVISSDTRHVMRADGGHVETYAVHPDALSPLIASEMDPDGQLPVHRFVTSHLRLEAPLA